MKVVIESPLRGKTPDCGGSAAMSEFAHVDYTSPFLERQRLSVCQSCGIGAAFRRCHAGLGLMGEWERTHRCDVKTEPCGPPEQTLDEFIGSPAPNCTCGREGLDVAGVMHSPMCPRGEWLIFREGLGR